VAARRCRRVKAQRCKPSSRRSSHMDWRPSDGFRSTQLCTACPGGNVALAVVANRELVDALHSARRSTRHRASRERAIWSAPTSCLTRLHNGLARAVAAAGSARAGTRSPADSLLADLASRASFARLLKAAPLFQHTQRLTQSPFGGPASCGPSAATIRPPLLGTLELSSTRSIRMNEALAQRC